MSICLVGSEFHRRRDEGTIFMDTCTGIKQCIFHLSLLWGLQVWKTITSRTWAEDNVTADIAELADAQVLHSVAADKYYTILHDILKQHASSVKRTVILRQEFALVLWRHSEEKTAAQVPETKVEENWYHERHSCLQKKEMKWAEVNRLCEQSKNDYYTGKVWGATSQEDLLLQILDQSMHKKRVCVLPSRLEEKASAFAFVEFLQTLHLRG